MGSSPTPAADSAAAQVAYPQWTGAAGDGVADDTAAWQAVVDRGARIIDGRGLTYKVTTAISVSASHLEIRNAKFFAAFPRHPKGGRNPLAYPDYIFYISGPASQTEVVFRNLHFSGSGHWGGLFAKILYQHHGWAAPGPPQVDELNYATTRTGFKIIDCSFDRPHFEAVFFTNVQADVLGCRFNAVHDHVQNGALVIRNTHDVLIDRCVFTNCLNKNVNTSYVKNLVYSNLTGNTDSSGTLHYYLGYYNRNCTMFNCVAQGGSYLKASYAASDITIKNCTFTGGDGYVMFQGAQNVSLTDCSIETTGPRALQLYYHNLINDLYCQKVRIKGCRLISTENGAAPPLVVDLSFADDSSLEECTVRGNVYAYPAQNLAIRHNKIFSHSSYKEPPAALYLRQFAGDGAKITGNSLVTENNVNTVYLNGNGMAGNVIFTDNTISNNAPASYAVVANYFTSGRFYYANNTMFGAKTGGEVSVNYTDSSKVTVHAGQKKD